MPETPMTFSTVYNRLIEEETIVTFENEYNAVFVASVSFPSNFGVQQGLRYLSTSKQKWLSGRES